MNDIIYTAIKNRHVLSLNYDGYDRLVEPHTYGISKAGHDVLRCYQTAGGHAKPGHTWDLLLTSKIRALLDTQKQFVGPRPEYRRGDRGMTRIYCEL